MTLTNLLYIAAAVVVVAWPQIQQAIAYVRALPAFKKGGVAAKLEDEVAY